MTTALHGAAAAPRTFDFRGAARPLGPDDIARAAARVRVPEAAYRALLITETGARAAFSPAGLPAILYEAHIAYRLCGVRVPGLSVPNWDRSLYGVTLAAEYDRLHQAIAHPKIGMEVALSAASWGLPQILGANYSACGYGHVAEFVAAMCASAAAQLGALNAFLEWRGIDKPLRALDWANVGRLYNGTAYRQNRYDEKLAANYRRALRGADDGVLAIGDVGPDVAEVQRALVRAGHAVVVDGDFGRRTALAVEMVQATYGRPATGRVDAITAGVLGLVSA